jgi:serine/threonine protein kinase
VNPATVPKKLQTGARLPTDTAYEVVVRGWRGEGSYARVYLAQYSRTGDACAVKLPKPEIPDAAARLDGERGLLARARHPHLVELLDSGRWAGAPFLVLEWLEGETLLDVVTARRRLPLRRALELLEPLCDVIAYLHGLGLAHGDLRPQNVIVTGSRGSVLTDPGPPDPAPPAQDVRGLGGLLHRMVTGEDSARGPRLTVAAGHNRGVAQLWEASQAAQPPSAAEMLAKVRMLRATL